MARMEMKVLNDTYYNPTSPAYFAGVNRVYSEAKKKDKRVRVEDVRNFLTLQDDYNLHKPIKKRFKRNVTQSAGIDVDWQADLADMQSLKKLNRGYSYILVCVDVFSRFAFAEPIKNKTAQVVADAFETIMKKAGRKCWILSTDRGKEFAGKAFQDMLLKHDIQYHFASSPDVKCAIAERYIRTLKGRLWRYFTKEKTLNYVKILQKIVTATNNSMHRTLGLPPAKVNKKNEKSIYKHQYDDQPKRVRVLFKAGDHVRITKEKHVLSKGYQPNFGHEIFVLTRRLKNRTPATYKLTDLKGEDIEGIFYNEELVRVAERSSLVIDHIIKSELKRKSLWHLVRLKNQKEQWVRDSALVKA